MKAYNVIRVDPITGESGVITRFLIGERDKTKVEKEAYLSASSWERHFDDGSHVSVIEE